MIGLNIWLQQLIYVENDQFCYWINDSGYRHLVITSRY